jgi:methyltransferase (TIGR00027 family)
MALSNSCIGCGAAAGVALLLQRFFGEDESKAIDSEAAFPTAQLVAAMRAKDAQTASPQIGSNIGGGPDRAAEALAGDLGFEFLKDMGGDHNSLAMRTMFFDEEWMKALDAGCKQFVILASGLDARAWRLPRLDKSVKIFEVDIPRAMAYKAQKIAEIGLECECTRIVVEADLSNPNWKQKLVSAGFDPTEESFFLIEGLLMYLPQEAPHQLLQAVSSLMQPGSTITGDTFINILGVMRSMSNRTLSKYGTKWTFEFSSDEALIAELADASFRDARVQNLMGGTVVNSRTSAEAEKRDDVHSDADKMARLLAGAASWPPISIEWCRARLTKENGAEELIREMVGDKIGFHGLKDKTAEHKAAVCDLLFADGCAAKLTTALNDVPVIHRSMMTKVYDTMLMMYMMYKAKKQRGASGYSLYVARKA